MSKIIESLKSGNYEVVDNQGVSVAIHFIECLEKEFADLETKLADLQQEQIKEMQEHQEAMELADKTITNLVEDNRASQEWYKKQLAESESRFQAHKQNDARIIQDQTDLIENLRQQLADTEEQNKRVLEKLELIVSANQELEQKLAEKDKEISNLKNIVNGVDTLKQYDQDAKQIILINPDNVYADGHRLVVKNADQDKISFAVEQLEQLKHDIWTDQQDDGWLDEQVDIYFLTETIDNQIKRLTHQHEDKGE